MLIAEFDVYRDKRTDKILSPNAIVSSEYGIGLAKENAGEDERYGFDAALSSHYTFNCGLKMSNSVSFGFTRDKQIEIREAPGTKNNPRKRKTGNRVDAHGDIKLPDYLRIRQILITGLIRRAYCLVISSMWISMVMVRLIVKTRLLLVSTRPSEVMWGYNLRLEYKNFDFSMFIQGAGGSDYYLGSNGDRNVRYPFKDAIHPRREHLIHGQKLIRIQMQNIRVCLPLSVTRTMKHPLTGW